MTENEIREIVTQHGLAGEAGEIAFNVGREVERLTRHEFFLVIQHANNAANSRVITARELDRILWDINSSKTGEWRWIEKELKK